MRLLVPAVLFIFCLHIRVNAQGVIAGHVFDASSGESLSGVYVISGKSKGTITDESGNFRFKAESQSVTVSFQFVGYRPASREVRVNPRDSVFLQIGMETSLTEIGQIVVSANKSEERVAELTVSMDVLKKADFLTTHITDAQELVNRTTGIEIMDGQASVRGGSGFSYGVGSRVLALIDGLPVLSPDAGNIKWQFLPLENISQIEIIKGASSVLYGSSAINGIINFRTADAGPDPETNFFAEAGIYDRPRNRKWVWWDTPRVYSDASFSHLRKVGNTDFGLALNLSADNGYRKYNEENLARLSFRLKHRNSHVKGLAYGLNVNSGYNSKTDFLLWEDAEYGALKQDTSSVSFIHGSFIAADPYVTLNNGGPFRHDLKMRVQHTSNRFPVRSNNNSDAVSYYTEYQGNYKFSDKFNITGGLAGTFNRINSNFYGDHNGMNLAVYSQAEVHPWERLKLIAGIRLEQNSLDSKKDKTVPVFRTGINFKAAEYTFLRASFGQGYRYPSVAERHASTTLGSVRIFPNPYVEPESGWSSEIGLKQGLRAGSFTGQADLSFFLSENTGMIEYVFSNYPDPVTGIFGFGFQATNVEQSRVYGYEVECNLKREGTISTSLSGGYTYIYPVEFNSRTNKNTETFLKYRRKHSARLTIDNTYRKLTLDVSMFLRSKVLNIDDVFVSELTREQILPGFYDYWLENNKGYVMLDGSLGYDLSGNLNLSLAVKNFTNTEYMGRPGDIQPQRSFSLRLTGNFQSSR